MNNKLYLQAMILNYRNKYNSKIFLALSTGLFLGVVLYIYQGYNISAGISFSGHNLLVRSSLFTITTIITFYLMEVLYFLSFSHLKIGYWRIIEVWLAGSLVFLLYNYFWQWSDLKILSYFKLLAEFTGIMVIPLAFHYLLYKKTKDSGNEMLKISAANGKQVIKIRKKDFLLAKAEDNYVKLFYLKNGDVAQHLVRATLSQTVNQINLQDVQQCHRSFVINRENIVHQEQKNNKLLLTIRGYPLPVPVSTKYQEQFALE